MLLSPCGCPGCGTPGVAPRGKLLIDALCSSHWKPPPPTGADKTLVKLYQNLQSLGKIDSMLTEQEKDILEQQELTPEERFPCRFPGCNRSFKYNGKSRRTCELSHEPPVQVDDPTQLTPSTPKETKPGDDVFNYNCALMTDSFLFFNFLDGIKEGYGVRL